MARSRLAVAQRRAEDLPRAGGRADEAEQQLDGRRLAGAVGAEQTDQLAAADGQAEAFERGGPAVASWRRRARSIAGVDTLAVTGRRQGSGHRSQRRSDGEVSDVRHRMPMVRRSGHRRGRRARRVRVRRLRHPRRGRRRSRSTTRSPRPPEDCLIAASGLRAASPRSGRRRALTAATAMPMSAIVVGPAGQVDQRATDEQADRLQAERDRPRRAPDPPEQVVGRIAPCAA